VPDGFPAGFVKQSLVDAINTIRSVSVNPVLVCTFNDMQANAGGLTIQSKQSVSITGTTMAGKLGGFTPRLWTRLDVAGVMYLAALTMRDQSAALNGGAINVQNGGRLVARGVSFMRLTVPNVGGAISVQTGGVVDIDRCVFDSNTVTDDCGSHPGTDGGHGDGGAIWFSGSSKQRIANSIFSNNHVGCTGGAIWTSCDTNGCGGKPPLSLTIVNSTFVHNSDSGQDSCPGGGGDMWAFSDNVGCPAPATSCSSGCVLQGDHKNLDLTLSH
jgi:hypothetical protein